jgi:hypothetical protein
LYYKTKSVQTPVNISAVKLEALFVKDLTRFEYKKKYKPALKKLMLEQIKERWAQQVMRVSSSKKR